jgi:hypothetical protein
LSAKFGRLLPEPFHHRVIHGARRLHMETHMICMGACQQKAANWKCGRMDSTARYAPGRDARVASSRRSMGRARRRLELTLDTVAVAGAAARRSAVGTGTRCVSMDGSASAGTARRRA